MFLAHTISTTRNITLSLNVSLLLTLNITLSLNVSLLLTLTPVTRKDAVAQAKFVDDFNKGVTQKSSRVLAAGAALQEFGGAALQEFGFGKKKKKTEGARAVAITRDNIPLSRFPTNLNYLALGR